MSENRERLGDPFRPAPAAETDPATAGPSGNGLRRPPATEPVRRIAAHSISGDRMSRAGSCSSFSCRPQCFSPPGEKTTLDRLEGGSEAADQTTQARRSGGGRPGSQIISSD